ncbi:protein of unknown function (plasmid) [Thermococcus nautili]|nr:protein of unknown function [Thermococcus nautili]
MSVSVLELLENPERAILSQKDSLPLLNIDNLSARHIEKLIRVKGKVVKITEPRGVIKVVAYVCPDGHVTKVDNPIIHPPEKITKCPKCGKPVRVSLEQSIPTDVREIEISGDNRSFRAFIVGAYATKNIEEGKEYIFTGTVKGQLDENTFQVEITHLELYHFEEAKGTEEYKEGKVVDVQSKVVEEAKPVHKPIKIPVDVTKEEVVAPTPSIPEEKISPSEELVVFEPKVEFRSGATLFGALSRADMMIMTFMNHPRLVVELQGVGRNSGNRFVEVFKDYWTLTWPELSKLGVKFSEIALKGEVAGNTIYLDAFIEGRTDNPNVDMDRNRISAILEKHTHQIYMQTGIRFRWKTKNVNLQGPSLISTSATSRRATTRTVSTSKPKDAGILAGLFGGSSEPDETHRTARISKKLKEDNINVGDVSGVVSEIRGLRQELGGEFGEVILEKVPKPSSRTITTQEIAIMKEILYEVDDEVGSIYGVPIDAVIERAVESGIPQEKANAILEQMKKTGMIFDGIKPGYIKLKR